ncbi:hypothetical protein KAU37_12110 [Candidatus Bipolaricaulota bacterium]|nr:hypothetical protein [Candidatus Bipolaricaulota bacterium]
MQIYSPHLMSQGTLIDYRLDKGTNLNGILGGYLIRDYEYALLRVQGSERRTKLQPGKRIRRLNPFSVYELIRINQQNNILDFELEADTRGLFTQVQDIPTLQSIECSISLTFRISDPYTLVVTNSIQSDQDLIDRMVGALNNTFLKLTRTNPQDITDTAGTLFEFIAMPTIRLNEAFNSPDEVDGVAYRIPLRFRSEATFLGILRERFGSLGIAPVDVEITNVKLPDEVKDLMNELFEARRGQAIAKETTDLEMIEARKRQAVGAVDALTEIQKGLAKKTVEIDFYYGALMRYGLDAKTAMLFKTLETTLGGEGAAPATAGSDPMNNLMRLYSLMFFKRVCDPGGEKFSSIKEEMNLSDDIANQVAEIKDPEMTKWISDKLRPLWDSLLLDKGLITPEQYQEIMDSVKQAAGGSADSGEAALSSHDATAEDGESDTSSEGSTESNQENEQQAPQ